VAFDGAIPANVEDGIAGPGFPVDVFNVLGAGDAFMAGLLRGWVPGEPIADALRYANACGAIVVSRHGCAPAMASWHELQHFLQHGSPHRKLREDALLEHIHRASTRRGEWPALAVLAFDHRSQFEEIVARYGAAMERIAVFKQLVVQAASQGYDAARGRHQAARPGQAFPHAGVIIDGRFGEEALPPVTGVGRWVARPVELPGSRPLAFEDGANVGLAMRDWPQEHVVKCLVSYHPDDEASLMQRQIVAVGALAEACHLTGHELLLEVIPPRDMPAAPDTLARDMQQFYDAGIRPDWWKLPPPDSATAWSHISATVAANDPLCRGVLLLGLEASVDVLREGFRVAAAAPLCKGFAVGRSLFADAAASWFAGTLDDAGVIAQVADRYARLIDLWCEARATTDFTKTTLEHQQ
jgi:5-dehydro-2-deoxygluconokinase